MVKVNPGKPAADIIRAKDLIVTGKELAKGATELHPVADPQVAALEKYILLADRGITMLGQLQGLMEKYRGIAGSRQTAEPEPMPVTRIPYEGDMPEMPSRENKEETEQVLEVQTAAVAAPTVGAAQISEALGMILMKEPELTVAQLKTLIDNNPDTIDNLLNAYMVSGGSVEGMEI